MSTFDVGNADDRQINLRLAEVCIAARQLVTTSLVVPGDPINTLDRHDESIHLPLFPENEVGHSIDLQSICQLAHSSLESAVTLANCSTTEQSSRFRLRSAIGAECDHKRLARIVTETTGTPPGKFGQ